MENDFEKLWNRIKSKYFKTMVLNTYNFEKLNHKDLVSLIELNRKNFNLKIKIKE